MWVLLVQRAIFLENGWRLLCSPKSTKMPEMAPSRVTNKKKPYETSELICNPISHEAFTQKWSRAINDVLCGNCLKGSLYFSPFWYQIFTPFFQSLKVDPTWLKRADNVLLAWIFDPELFWGLLFIAFLNKFLFNGESMLTFLVL